MIETSEAGRPPQSSEELLALRQVMVRHGIEQDELGDFARTVYAACADHLYPDLLHGEDWSQRPDGDGMAEVLYARSLTRNGEVSAAWLLALVDELTAAVGDGEGPRRGRARRHRQQAALVFARASLAACTDRARDRRARWTGDLLARNTDAIAAHFGPDGLGGRLSVVGQGVMAAWQHGHHGHLVPWRKLRWPSPKPRRPVVNPQLRPTHTPEPPMP